MASDVNRILETGNLISFWDFQEEPGRPRVSRGPQQSVLLEGAAPVPVSPEGLFGSRSARFGGGQYLYVPRAQLGRLDVHGERAQVTVVAWLRRCPGPADWQCEAVAGVWNEHAKRQYAMFLNLRIHDSAQQVGAHISGIGEATPGFKYCMDAAIGATPIAYDRWHCLAITYDGSAARAFVDGHLDERPGRNPFPYAHGIFTAGQNGGDFTVGAVTRPEKVTDDHRDVGSIVANRFHGDLAGLAVFDRALSAAELQSLAQLGDGDKKRTGR